MMVITPCTSQVLATVRGPCDVTRRSDVLHDRAIINVNYSVAPFAVVERKRVRPGDKRTAEMSLSLREVFGAAVLVELYPRSQIDIEVIVLQADGSRLPACINGITLALCCGGVTLKDLVVSCSAGLVDGQTVVDLNYAEQSMGAAAVPIAILPNSGSILLAKMEARLPLDVFEKVLTKCMEACFQVHVILVEVLKEYARNAPVCMN